jgi:ribosomal-protein-alanine N-acetyltransferase
MRLALSKCEIRSWRREDAKAIARHADNRKIWRNLRDIFPHPYTLKDAHEFLDLVIGAEPETVFCIASEEEAIGAIGLRLQEDVDRFSAEIGYWLGESYWGRGIMTEALSAVTEYAVRELGFHRIFATPFAWNPGSCRVLEKARYVLEGRMRHSAWKDGQFVDQLLYSFIAEAGA